MASAQYITHLLYHSIYAKFSMLWQAETVGYFFLITVNWPIKTLVVIPRSPLSHNYYIEPIKGSVIREIFMPVHRFSDNVLLPSIGSQHYTQNL